MAATPPSPPRRWAFPAHSLRSFAKRQGETGCGFAELDFPIGVPSSFTERGGISSFRTLLPNLGTGDWENFYSACDKPDQICVHRPFYPNGAYKGRRKEDLFRGHGVSSLEPQLRRCERGGNGQLLKRTWALLE